MLNDEDCETNQSKKKLKSGQAIFQPALSSNVLMYMKFILLAWMSQFFEEANVSKHRNRISCDKKWLGNQILHIQHEHNYYKQNLVAFNAGLFQRQSSRTEQLKPQNKLHIINRLSHFFFFDGPALGAGIKVSHEPQSAYLVSQGLVSYTILAGLIKWS